MSMWRSRAHTALETKQRRIWVTQAPDAHLLETVAQLSKGYHPGDSPSDTIERMLTIAWVSTRGASGQDWGFPLYIQDAEDTE